MRLPDGGQGVAKGEFLNLVKYIYFLFHIPFWNCSREHTDTFCCRQNTYRQTFRSGNPPAPMIMKDLYDRLFWYGFDPDETTTAADKTMFGGTKGKFNGLGLLQDINEGPRRSERRRAGRRRRLDDNYYYEGDDDMEDEYVEYTEYGDENDEYEEIFEDEEWRNKNPVGQLPPAAYKDRKPPTRSQRLRSTSPLPTKNDDSIKNFNDVLDLAEETISSEDERRDNRKNSRRS